MTGRIGESSSQRRTHVASAATAAIAVRVIIVVVEEDGFRGRGEFQTRCCEFFVEFAGTSASDAVGDEAMMSARPTSPTTLKTPATAPVL